MRWWAVLLVPALAACAGAPPKSAEAACPNGSAALPAEWAAWTRARQLAAVASQDHLATARFAPGEAVDLRLLLDPQVTYLTLPKAAGEATSYGGLALLHIERAGSYGVGLGGFAWVDLTRDGKPTEPTSFGHGPDCSPVRKVVRFDLTPGEYVLEISGNRTSEIDIMVVGGS